MSNYPKYTVLEHIPRRGCGFVKVTYTHSDNVYHPMVWIEHNTPARDGDLIRTFTLEADELDDLITELEYARLNLNKDQSGEN